PSPQYFDAIEQALETTKIAQEIIRTEDLVGHQRTVLVGDFNMDTFHPGVVGAEGFHGMMTRDLVEARERTVSGRAYRFFYNPMWRFFGDHSPGPPGSYFYSGSTPVVF